MAIIRINNSELEINPRRLYETYDESDKDYVLNNLDTCVWLLDYLLELRDSRP